MGGLERIKDQTAMHGNISRSGDGGTALRAHLEETKEAVEKVTEHCSISEGHFIPTGNDLFKGSVSPLVRSP